MFDTTAYVKKRPVSALPALSVQNVLRAVLALAFIHALVVLFIGLNKPLLDMHYFRQTQTSLTTYWMLKGGPWFAYETPVIGAPWALPIEFPIYQLLTTAVAAAGVPLDAAGRLVAFAFFLGALWPLRMLFNELKLGDGSYFATAILFLTCPLYIYWSRTFMVESCALFFALLWLAFIAHYLNRRNSLSAAGAIAAGCLAVLAKSTTFPAFTLVGCAGAAVVLGREWLVGERKASLKGYTLVAIAVGLPYLLGLVWTAYADSVKSANEFGRLLTAAALSHWYFGDLRQRFSAELWLGIVRDRVIPDTLGVCSLLAFAVLGGALTSRRSLIVMGAALAAFVTPFLIFTNVHIVHNYYQVANALFLIAAVGVGAGCIFDRGQRTVALLAIATIAAGQLYFFYGHFFPELTRDYSQSRWLRISKIAQRATQPGQSLIVIGDDWASAVPYYAQRKSLVLAYWFPLPLIQRVFAEPQSFLDESPLGGIVFCADRLPFYNEALVPAIQAFVLGRAVIGEFGGCQLLAP